MNRQTDLPIKKKDADENLMAGTFRIEDEVAGSKEVQIVDISENTVYVVGNMQVGGGAFIGRDRRGINSDAAQTASEEKPSQIPQHIPTLQELEQLVKQMHGMMPGASLDTDTVEVLDNDFATLEKQLNTPAPKVSIIVSRLNSVKEIVSASGGAASNILPFVRQAVDMAVQLFK